MEEVMKHSFWVVTLWGEVRAIPNPKNIWNNEKPRLLQMFELVE